MRHLCVIGAVAVLVSACARPRPQPVVPVPPRDFVAQGREAMVVTAHPAATAAGIAALQAGGNAVDAFAATSFAVSVVRPQSTGIGGGGFAVLYLKQSDGSRQALAFDFRERAPAAANRDLFADPDLPEKASLFGPLAIATPGLVAGILEIHERFGKLPRQLVMRPAIVLAEEGFPVYPALSEAMRRMAPVLSRYPESARTFLHDGAPLDTGDILRQPALAETLRAVSSGGREAFYEGPVARALVAEVRRVGGILAAEDLAAYRVVERPVVRGRYRDYEFIGMPPPSSGGVLMIEMLNMLAAAGPGAGEGSGADRIHLLAEVMRRAYEDRADHFGDPDFVDVPVERLTAPSYAAERMADFDPQRAGGGGVSPEGKVHLTSTTHISILDTAGNAVAATETINYAFGSGITVPGTGVLLNNEMDDFATRPGVPNVYGLVGDEANAVAPGKTPLSSMSPTIVTRDGTPVLIAGSPGGSVIITATLQTILNVIDRAMPLPAAVAAPRIHHQAVPNRIHHEPGAIDAETAKELRARGHELHEMPSMGDVQAVMRQPSGLIVGVSDPRGEGRPAGY